MTPDEQLDAWLEDQLREPAIDDAGFSQGVGARVARVRARRRWVIAGGLVLSVLAGGIAIYLSPAPLLPEGVVRPGTVAAALVLATVCSLLWIATEPRSLSVVEAATAASASSPTRR